MTLTQNSLTGVVLSGGGAHGAYEAGVLKALMTGAVWTTGGVPLAPDVITGTSIGAYNGAVLTARLEAEAAPAVARALEDVWLNVIPQDEGDPGHNHVFRFRGNPLDLLRPGTLARQPARLAGWFGNDALFFAQDWVQRGTRFLFSPNPSLAQRSLELVDLSTLISREPTERLLRRTIDLGLVRQSRRTLFLAVTNWGTGGLELFTNADVADAARKSGFQVRRLWSGPDATDADGYQAVLASSSLPGVFPPVSLGGQVYVDGGLSLNTPLGPAFLVATPGPDTVHVIYLDPEAQNIPLPTLQSTIETMDRLITIGLSNSVDSDMRVADRVNRGLDLVDRARQGERPTAGQMRTVIESAAYLMDGIGGRVPDSPKTIHRYRPSSYLGGTLSLLDFSRARVAQLIDMGFQDAVKHDCVRSKCVLPGTGMQQMPSTQQGAPAGAGASP
jgi:predicted acylesterase/phospholipase RssA